MGLITVLLDGLTSLSQITGLTPGFTRGTRFIPKCLSPSSYLSFLGLLHLDRLAANLTVVRHRSHSLGSHHPAHEMGGRNNKFNFVTAQPGARAVRPSPGRNGLYSYKMLKVIVRCLSRSWRWTSWPGVGAEWDWRSQSVIKSQVHMQEHKH
jgi:hypothetical protein